MATSPFLAAIPLYDYSKAGIRWRVSIQPALSCDQVTVVRFLKRGRTGRLLDQLCTWSWNGWVSGSIPSTRVPESLRQQIEAMLLLHHRSSWRPVPADGGSLSQ